MSYTPVNGFRAYFREVETTAWTEENAEPIPEGPYHYAGKLFLKDLKYATRYEAKVQARNTEGWGNMQIFYFATKGAGS